MESNSVSPMPELAPIAEFDKSPPTPPEDTVPMDDLPPPPATVNMHEDKEKEKEKEKEVSLSTNPYDEKKIRNLDRTLKFLKLVDSRATRRRFIEESDWGCGSWLEYIVVVVLAFVLLLGALAATIYWTVSYRGELKWQSGDHDDDFNLHPILMVGGFITLSGLSALLYRLCRCCRTITLKLMHALLHALALASIGLGAYVSYEWHNNADNGKHLYTLHSLIGILALGLFALQFVVGFFSFLLLMCCGDSTSSYRCCLVPIHASFGMSTLWCAIAACVTGLMQVAQKDLATLYSSLNQEAILINTIGISIVSIGILITYVLHRDEFRVKAHVLVRTGEI